MKPRRFWFHLNKPETRKQGRPVWTIHYKGKCISVASISCLATIETWTNKRQPIAVVRGLTDKIVIRKGADDSARAIIL